MLLSAVFFHELASHVIDGFATAEGFVPWLLNPANLPLTASVLGILAFAGGIFYMMLIFVPRELADPGGSALSWAVRFGVFFVSLLAAIVVGGTLPVITPP